MRQTSIVAAGAAIAGGVRIGRASPNEKLNIGVIGIAHQGRYNLDNVAGENIVALCDVNDTYLKEVAGKFPQAKTYNDFRRLLELKDIDAVVVATPDHTHAVATVGALRSGRHVYSEKPLTRTLSECRAVMNAARESKKATQLGTQIHAGTNYRRTVELVQSGVIGPIREVHVWVNATYGGKTLPKDAPAVPADLHYDLWLGPVPARPYSPEYVPIAWRNWWAFGGGALADFGCHFMDLPHWALGLGAPDSADVIAAQPPDPECPPPWLILRYDYPAREKRPPVALTWYHGGKQPSADILAPELAAKWKSGVLFIGSQGQILADYGNHLLLPEKDFAGHVAPAPSIPDSIGHHLEWIRACKTGQPTTCNFDYSGTLTEAVLVGNLAFRVNRRIEWDTKKLRAKNCPEATAYIQHHYRPGWQLI